MSFQTLFSLLKCFEKVVETHKRVGMKISCLKNVAELSFF